MFRCTSRALAAAVVAISVAAPAAAQMQRAFPQDTLRGAMVFGEYPQITLNGNVTRLSPGARVRDQDSRIVLPGAFAGGRLLVHYTLDIGGVMVRDVWVLRPEEAAIRPWPSTLDEARAWTFDATTQTWIKP